MSTRVHPDIKFTEVRAPLGVLQSALSALSDGRIADVVAAFDDDFTFNDHALELEFKEKIRLTEFLQKARELFPNTLVEATSIFEDRHHAIAEWKLTATHTEPYGSIGYLVRILVHGSTVVQIEDGRITRWSDYYDRATSRRFRLAGFFTEWTEY
jgi:steroid delta-isomerase-like uncharacterized protein